MTNAVDWLQHTISPRPIANLKDLGKGIGVGDTLVSMGTGDPAGSHQNVIILVPRKFQKLGTDGYRVPAK